MSNSASLAAAKKRRSQPVKTSKQDSINTQNNKEYNQAPVTPVQLLKTHDMKIFALENKLLSLNDEIITKTNLDLLQLNDSQNTKINNSVINQVENNNTNISNLKTHVTTFSDNMNELKSTIQLLHATILSQKQEIEEIKQFMNKINITENSTTEKNDSTE